MAEKTIKNPSLLPGDLEIELSGGSIIAISGHPLIGSGGETQSDYVYYPVFDDTTGNVEFHLGTTKNNPQPSGGWHISGATGPQGIQGEQGIQGIPGVDGKNPVFEIDSSNAHWRWKYAEATSGWTDLGVVASGTVGPKGQDGTNGVTPGVRIDTNTNKWEIAADGKTWVSTDVNATGPQGTKGEKGEKGDPGQQGPSGAPGKDGAPGVDGKDGITPHIGVNNHWYIGDSDTGVSATGPQGLEGPQGIQGEKGDQGEIGPEGPKGDIGPQGEQGPKGDKGDTGPQGPKGDTGEPGTNGIDGKDGKDGTNGKDGVSPTVSSEQVFGGTEVTFTYGTGQTETITVFDGTPGAAGASGYSPIITLEHATSTSYPNGGTKVTIADLEHQAGQEFYVWNGNDGQGATVNLLEGTGIKIDKLGQDYTIGVSGDYASTSDVEAASANAYDKAVAKIPDVTNFITKDVNNLTYYYDKTETSSTSEITNALSTKLDSTVAEQTYQTKTDMTNYLTTSDASTTYQPKGNYATTSDISDMATQTWVGQRGYLTQSDLASYATETYVDTASAAALSQAKTWVNQQNFATSAGLAANTRYEMTNTGWTSAIKIQVDTQVPTTDDGILHIILES